MRRKKDILRNLWLICSLFLHFTQNSISKAHYFSPCGYHSLNHVWAVRRWKISISSPLSSNEFLVHFPTKNQSSTHYHRSNNVKKVTHSEVSLREWAYESELTLTPMKNIHLLLHILELCETSSTFINKALICSLTRLFYVLPTLPLGICFI